MHAVQRKQELATIGCIRLCNIKSCYLITVHAILKNCMQNSNTSYVMHYPECEHICTDFTEQYFQHCYVKKK